MISSNDFDVFHLLRTRDKSFYNMFLMDKHTTVNNQDDPNKIYFWINILINYTSNLIS